jgi:hypothetical protein
VPEKKVMKAQAVEDGKVQDLDMKVPERMYQNKSLLSQHMMLQTAVIY